MPRTHLFLILLLLPLLTASARDDAPAPVLSHTHGLYENAFTLTLSCAETSADIVYTTDGSLPDSTSSHYSTPLSIDKTTLVRARSIMGDRYSKVVTASYLFIDNVLNQPDLPSGFPETWGSYATRQGTAKADYGMDSKLTGDVSTAASITDGLRQLPIVSLVTERSHFFGMEPDSEHGGIYIYTGASKDNHPGHGWERPVSFELFGGPQHFDLQSDCGARIHGGQSRLPEKSPKHSLRLTWRQAYGEDYLHASLYGQEGPETFHTLILRTAYNNSWLHGEERQRKTAQYCRDLWARTVMQHMGHPAADGIWAHLFLDGLYWGMYNVSERIDGVFCASHLGGSPEEWDVVKVEEQGEENICVASEGDLDCWETMLATASCAATSDSAYYRLDGRDACGIRDTTLECLLDIDNFIDYMILNQYAGNTDWDVHNWYAIHRHGDKDEGFQFLCWDTEMIFGSKHENVLIPKGFRKGILTELFTTLMDNARFNARFQEHVQTLCTREGMLTPDSVIAVWNNLYYNINHALYTESARWGDYRCEVHPGKGRGENCTVDVTFAKERKRLLEDYFPGRTAIYLKQLRRRGWYR